MARLRNYIFSDGLHPSLLKFHPYGISALTDRYGNEIKKGKALLYIYLLASITPNLTKMSLHFQIDIAFDFHEDSPPDIISGLEALSNRLSLSEQQKQSIPVILQNEVKGMTGNLSFAGTDIFYFKRHYRSARNGADIYKWTFHFRTMLSDDVFYQQGYPLLAWLALHSGTMGFVGYVKEEFDVEPRILYFDKQEVIIKESADKEIKYKYADFY